LNEILKNQSLSEGQVRLIMEQLLLTIDFIHKKGVVHRDIKLDNILINKIEEGEYKVKIADFGMASFIKRSNNGQRDDGQLYMKCGTPGYVAPEILRGEGYNSKCDIFSMGSLFFNLLTGLYLFSGEDQK
jgi:serine/threonine protein kinase